MHVDHGCIIQFEGYNTSMTWTYLDEGLELTIALAASLVSMVHLQSMVNSNNANANFR